MFNGESKKRPTVSLRGKSKEEDRTEFIRRARAQREGRARERLHTSCAINIQRFWRGRYCVGKWREEEREGWDKKMHDVGRVEAMLAAAGKVFQVPSAVLYGLLSHLVNFHVFPRDESRFRAAVALVVAAASDPSGNPHYTGLFAPLASSRARKDSGSENSWMLLMGRLGTLCLQYIANGATSAAAQVSGVGVSNVAATHGGMVDVDGHSGAVSGAAAEYVGVKGLKGQVEEAVVAGFTEAMQAFALISSPQEWKRGLLQGGDAEAEALCRRLLVSLALGRFVLSEKKGATADGNGPGVAAGFGAVEIKKGGPSPPKSASPLARRGAVGVRLVVRADQPDAATGSWTRSPRLFEVLRVHWDAAATMTGGPKLDPAKTPSRLLCSASLEALGISGRAPVDAARHRRTPLEGPSNVILRSGETLESFASAILPSPRLLEHPCRQFLVDPMLAGDARAWWELVAGAGDAVGATDGGATPLANGPVGTRRDVAWTVANILRVDTGTGGTGDGAGVQHARCLVRALCRLLRRVSLHAVLKGAGQTASTAVSDTTDDASGGQFALTELDEDVEMDDFFSGAADNQMGTGAGAAGAAGDNNVSGRGGVRLEDTVRYHRRRCALRAAAVAPEPTPDPPLPSASGSKPRGGASAAGDGGGSGDDSVGARLAAARAAGDEIEAMRAAAGTLADASVVGKLFDTLLPPVGQQEQHASFSSGKPFSRGAAAAAVDSGPGDKCGSDEDPVLSLCSLYADLVMDGVRAGPAVTSSAASGSGGGGSGGRETTPTKSVLNALAFGQPRSPIAARLWAYLRGRHDLSAYAEGSGAASGNGRVGGDAAAGVQSVLFLFCSAYSHQLLALDDEEFYEKQTPLSLEGVRQLAGFLKTWLCRLYWLDPAMPRLLHDNLPTDPVAALKQCEDRLREALLLLAATRLFNQLYERNTRRTFLDPEAWYWKAISAQEVNPLERRNSNSDPRADIFSNGNLGMVLTNIPQVIPFFQRVKIFRHLIEEERQDYQPPPSWTHSSVRIRVSRDTLYEDSAEQLNQLGGALKGRIQVTFMNQHGVEEAGIDGGGVFKEYMDLLTKRAFDPQYALFLATEDQYLFPNPSAELVTDDYLFHFEFLGRVLAKAVFEDILVEPLFSPVFLNKLLGRHSYIDDLYSLDPELYRNLMHLKTIVHQGGDVSDLCLTFSATTSAFGETKVWDLIPGGRDVAVTNGSVIGYIHLMAHFKLNVQTARPSMAFLRGFRDLIPLEWIQLFNSHELQRLIGGEGDRDVDFDDLKRNTRYGGGYHESQPVMQWFWDTVRSFDKKQQGQFLKFVTSCSRPPLLGFERLNPPICVQRVGDGEEGRLPSSSTCMNLLKLPQYTDQKTLRDKLLYAISANAGFELT